MQTWHTNLKGTVLPRFWGRDKTADVQAGASTVVKALAPDHQHRNWQTRPLIVARRICPAAFVNEPLVAFCTLSDLPEAILDATAITSTEPSYAPLVVATITWLNASYIFIVFYDF